MLLLYVVFGRHLAAGTLALLLISVGNLLLIAVAVFYPNRELSESRSLSKNRLAASALALCFASLSQILYLGFAFAWWFDWIRSYPGNPLQAHMMSMGLIFSAAATVTAILGIGIRRCAAVFVGIATAGLWLLSMLASAAV